MGDNSLGYAFLCHQSACEVLRSQGIVFPRWPETPRLLPTRGGCIVGQRDFARLAREVDFGELGVYTTPVDILVPNTQFRHKGKRVRTHPWSNLLVPSSLLRVHQNVLVSSPEFTLLLLANVHVRQTQNIDRSVDLHRAQSDALGQLGVAEEVPFEDFVAWAKIARQIEVAQIAMEFSGTYRLPVRPGGEATYDVEPLTTVKRVQDFLDSIPPSNTYKHSSAPKALSALLPWVLEGSRSPMETMLSLLLTLPVECGGFGLPQPQLNVIPRKLQDRAFEADILWEDAAVIVEYDSSEFHAGMGADKTDADIMRANSLRSMGYTVLEVTPGIALDRRRVKTLAGQLERLLRVEHPEEDHVVQFRRTMLQQLFAGQRGRRDA